MAVLSSRAFVIVLLSNVLWQEGLFYDQIFS